MATKPAASTAVTTQQSAFGVDKPAYIKDTARGSEEVRTEDMVLPRLELVQALSPIKETDPTAKEGYLFNSVTQEVIGDVAYFVDVYFKVEYLVWKLQSEGGGFFGAFSNSADAEKRRQEAIDEGNDPDHVEVIDTPVHYGMRVTPDGVTCEQIVVSMSKTKAKVSRKWNALIQLAGGDRFSRVYKLTSFVDANKKGQKFYNFVVQNAGYTPEPVYRKAEQLYEVLKRQGGATVAHESVVEMPIGDEDTARGEV